MNNTSMPDLLTVKQAAEVFHLCRQSIYKYIQDGTIPAFKDPAGKYLIPRKYVDDLTASCSNATVAIYCDDPTEGGIRYV